VELLTPQLKKVLPALYAQENSRDPIAYLKFLTPDSNWTWYVTEGSEQDGDFVFFGYVCGFANELGYFCLSELGAVRGPGGLPIERDLYFEPTPLSHLRDSDSSS
jgi:hypothetical protein